MNTIQLLGAFELGVIYCLVGIGVYLSFRVLQFPDLTVDGSFPLGAAVSVACILHGMNPFLAIVIAGAIGGLSGWITAILSSYLKILNLLAGILTMTALYSINLRIMGNKPNLSLLGESTIFSILEDFFPVGFPVRIVTLVVIVTAIAMFIIRFLKSQTGLAIRAVGCNPRMARAQGVKDPKMIALGLSLSNACIALSGALFAQVFGFADVTLGVGTIIIGLASVIIGEALLPHRTVAQAVLGCMFGAILYRVLIACALNMGDLGLKASDLNLITVFLVIFAMSLPKLKEFLNKKSQKLKMDTKS